MRIPMFAQVHARARATSARNNSRTSFPLLPSCQLLGLPHAPSWPCRASVHGGSGAFAPASGGGAASCRVRAAAARARAARERCQPAACAASSVRQPLGIPIHPPRGRVDDARYDGVCGASAMQLVHRCAGDKHIHADMARAQYSRQRGHVAHLAKRSAAALTRCRRCRLVAGGLCLLLLARIVRLRLMCVPRPSAPVYLRRRFV